MKNYIEKTVNHLINKYNTQNPFELLNCLGISTEFNSSLTDLKGFFAVVNNKKFVVINSNLPEESQRAVAAHELGHCCLHEHFAQNTGFREFMLYDMETKPEYEANLFAALLLISDENIEEAARMGYCGSQMAAYLNVDEKLLQIRLQNVAINIPASTTQAQSSL